MKDNNDQKNIDNPWYISRTATIDNPWYISRTATYDSNNAQP